MAPCPLLDRFVERQSSSDSLGIGEVFLVVKLVLLNLKIEGSLVVSSTVSGRTSLLDFSLCLGGGVCIGPFGLVLGRVVGDGLGDFYLGGDSYTSAPSQKHQSGKHRRSERDGVERLTSDLVLVLGGEAQLLVLGERLGDSRSFGSHSLTRRLGDGGSTTVDRRLSTTVTVIMAERRCCNLQEREERHEGKESHSERGDERLKEERELWMSNESEKEGELGEMLVDKGGKGKRNRSGRGSCKREGGLKGPFSNRDRVRAINENRVNSVIVSKSWLRTLLGRV